MRRHSNSKTRGWIRRPLFGCSGITLVEVMVAAFLLLVTFFGLSTVYSRGRAQMLLEVDRRQATSILQSRLDSIRRELIYDDLADLHETFMNYQVNGKTYQIAHSVSSADPEPQASTVTVSVSWNARIGGSNVARTQSCTTILTRTTS